jgi:hypothetical protein
LVSALAEQLPQRDAAVRLQHPAALEIGREQGRNPVGHAPRQELDDAGLEGLRGHVRLEPERSGLRRDA